MKMRSVMSHAFSMVPSAEIPRSSFDRSHGYKTTFDAGYLVPFFLDEALPGDTFNLSVNGFARLATPIFPVMDNMFLDVHFFGVPLRLLWENWERFNGAQDNPGDSTDFTIPILDYTDYATVPPVGSLWDYFGLPMVAELDGVSALPFRAYVKIWDEWFRDENLQDSVFISGIGDGPDEILDYLTTGTGGTGLLRRGKRHDYFTSCLPWPQKGDAVSIPLGTTAPVVPFGDREPQFDLGTTISARLEGSLLNTIHSNPAASADNVPLLWNATPGETKLQVDLTNATAATINALRQAFQIQRLYERDARGGTRYTEILRSHFGVISPDARLQRSEYLGGGSTRVNFVSVPNTTGTTGEHPQGELAAYATATIEGGNGFVKSFTEHCYIIGLLSVRADLTYQQGLNRLWSRSGRFDFYWPALSHIGEQAVLNKEIACVGTPAQDDDVFGYQERYAEYRYKPSMITGLFRSSAAGTLDSWHLSQVLEDAPPLLDAAFIQEDPPIDRIIAVPSEPHFLFDSYIQLRCARPMPVYGVPGMIDHF